MVSVLLRQVKFLDLHKLSQLSTILFSLIFVFNYYKYSWTQTRPFHKEYDNCQTLLQRGQWSANYTASTPQIWQPQNCVMHNYTLEDVKKCSPEPSRIIFWGDSTARQIFWKMLQIMDPSTVPDGNQHGNMRFTRHGVAVTMFFDPYLNKTEGGIDQIINLSQNETEAGHTTILYITTGLWHSLFNPREGVVDSYKRTVDNVTAILRNQIIGAFGAVYFNPTQIPQYELLDASRKGKIDAKYLDPMRDYSDSVFNYDRENARNGGEPGAFEGVIFTHDNRPAAYYTPVFDQIGPGHLSLYDGIGLHYRDAAVEVQAQTLLNHVCNRRIFPPNHSPYYQNFNRYSSKNATNSTTFHVPETRLHRPTCCVQYARPLVTVNTFLPLLVIPAIVGIVMLINAKTSVLKAVANVVLTSVVAGIYSFLCDRTHMINKATMYPQWAQFAALTQIWVVVTVLFVGRVRNDPQQPGAGSVTTLTSFFSSTELLNEFKGVLISVWLIITVSGMKTMPTGAHLAEILQVVLLFVAVYHATLVGAQSTKRTLVDLARALLPTSLLALLLDMEFSFYQMAAKMVLWTTFVALVNVRRVGLIPSLGMVSALAGLYYIGASAFSSGSDRVFYIITFDYAIGVLAVLAGTVVAHHQQKAIRAATAKVGNSTSSSNSDQGTLVKLVVNSIPFKLVIVAVSFVFIYTVSIPLLNHEHDIVSTHHTKWPALSLIVVYVGLRLMVSGATGRRSSSSSQYLYSRSMAAIGGLWLELTVYSNHILMAGDGTLRLIFMTTGNTYIDTFTSAQKRGLFDLGLVIAAFWGIVWNAHCAWQELSWCVEENSLLSLIGSDVNQYELTTGASSSHDSNDDYNEK